jgi:hypothetical protein
MDDNILIILFLYEELNPITIDILNFIKKNNMIQIITMEIKKTDYNNRNWLLHNEKNIKIDKFPVFIISQTNKSPEIKNGTIPEAKNIFNIIRKLI